jgi:Rrf2 family protein
MRLIMELARNYGQGPLSMSVISRRQEIPVKYLEQLIIPLKKGGLIKSVRGPKGGHALAKHPGEINVWEVIHLLETKVFFIDCLRSPEACEHSDTCIVRPVWGRAYEAMKAVFEGTSLEQILQEQDNKERHL